MAAKTLITFPGLNGEPSALPDGPASRPKSQRAQELELASLVTEKYDRWCELPRAERQALEREGRARWIAAQLGGKVSVEFALNVVDLLVAARKPRSLG